MPRFSDHPQLAVVAAKLEAVASVATQLLAIVRECERTLRDLRNQPTRLTVMAAGASPEAPLRLESGPRVLRIGDVTRRVGLSKSTVWKMASEGIFPRPSKLGERRVGWLASEVEAWLAGRFHTVP